MPDRPKDTLIRQRVAELIEANRPQKRLAEAAGVPQSLLSSIVTGARADLRADTVARIARACGLTPEALGTLLYECVAGKANGEPGRKIPVRD